MNETLLSFLLNRQLFSGFQENPQKKNGTKNESNVENESNVVGSSHFGKLIKNLKDHGVWRRCRVADIRGE